MELDLDKKEKNNGSGSSSSISTTKEVEKEETSASELDEIEKSKVAIMRALVQREDPSSKVVLVVFFSFLQLYDFVITKWKLEKNK